MTALKLILLMLHKHGFGAIPILFGMLEWPPYSPDLNPMDYSIWSILETNACSKSHTNVESLKRALCREWERIPQETLRAAVDAFPRDCTLLLKQKVATLKNNLYY
ncbi:hypothetical protein LOD99_14208 [Oopsacas minuta]|uniref:Tc1-like transposase DDE domain-containing protein n=1 Tax=Oopsacas minuta TaxID=111878 RepID=A0AAV7KFG2_9METZ|nr:hypothetical protein LOD99_14208 [Oopsacas minuta]